MRHFTLHRLVTRLIGRTRDWKRRVVQVRSADRSDERDDLYEIFLFGPHG